MTILDKLNKPEIITATYRIVTPMFIGDAQQKATGISPASVKGALRFWWRALNWGRVASACHSETEALKQLHEEEAVLFGTASGDGKGAAFTLQTSYKKPLKTTKKGEVHQDFAKHDAARYLGYGVMESFKSRNKGTEAGQLTRSCINADQVFVIKIIFHSKIDNTIIDSLKALGLFGGLGSRARKGFGSINLENIQSIGVDKKVVWNSPNSIEAYHEEINSLFSEVVLSKISLPPFTAFSSKTRIDSLLTVDNPYGALNQYAKSMLLYRSWGKDGKVLGCDSEKRFEKKDHDFKYKKHPNGSHPERIIFGLPHNYGKGDHLAVTPEKHERRASPLFFHVHKIQSRYLGISIVIPAIFLPQDEKINAGGKNVIAKPNWKILMNFLDGKTKNEEDRFPDKTSILKGENV